ncbi:unnamed protein product [Larinioides sclopetarius]|uniref:Uncharacterized protein n=1 Tax=Larinioides sclopetarius TaxID=280406 RepID=A0AAV2B678_9ARAC
MPLVIKAKPLKPSLCGLEGGRKRLLQTTVWEEGNRSNNTDVLRDIPLEILRCRYETKESSLRKAQPRGFR